MKCSILSFSLLLIYLLLTTCQSDTDKKQNKNRLHKKQSTGVRPTLIPDKLDNCRAISLKLLQLKTQEYQKSGKIPENILQLFGITKILGFIADKASQDIIIYGVVDKTLPPLHLEDFVVALRNAWFKYAQFNGNTYTYEDPSCTIDPDPGIMRQLEKISMSYKHQQQGYNKWKETCNKPMKVQAFGIPFNSRFNSVLVEADYYMKKIVNGSVNLNINGLTSLNDTAWSIMKSQLTQGSDPDLPIHPFNRFWFFPGEYWFYGYDDDIYLKRLPVTLKTEEEAFSQTGNIVGKGKADPLAHNFTLSFSEHYSEIAKKKPIYAQLEGLFRIVAIAKALKYSQQPIGASFHECCKTKSGLDLSYLLNVFPVKNYFVKSNLPGISDIKDFTFNSNSSVHYLWLPSCGGVEIKIDVSNRSLKRSNYERSVIQEIHIKTIQSKSQESPFWDVNMDMLVNVLKKQMHNKFLEIYQS
jgi:hypothetical protein